MCNTVWTSGGLFKKQNRAKEALHTLEALKKKYPGNGQKQTPLPSKTLSRIFSQRAVEKIEQDKDFSRIAQASKNYQL